MAIVWDSLVRPDDLTTFVRNVPVQQQYVLDQLLPNRIINDVEVDIRDVTITQRTAKFRAWDAAPTPGTRDTFTRKSVKLPAVSQMLSQGELDKLRQMTAAARGGSDNAVIQAIYDDAENNTRSVQNRVELARGDLLNDGKVTLAELGTGIEADFGVPGGHIVSTSTSWATTASATPLADLRAWVKTYRATNGFEPGGMVLSVDTVYYMLENTAIRALFAGTGGTPSIIGEDDLNSLLRKFRLPPIALTYDAQVNVDGVATDILDSDQVLFVPPAGVQLGETIWGLTTTGTAMSGEGVNLAGGPAGLVGVVDEDARPPYRQAVYVDATCLPVLTNPRALFIATVIL